VWFWAARNSPEEHPWTSAAELEHIAAGRGDAKSRLKPAERAKPGKTPWGRILTSRNILAITGSYFTYGYVSWIFFSWFYIYLAQVRGLSLKTSAWFSMLPFMAMTVGCLLGGTASDWLAKHVSERAGRSYLPCFALVMTGVLLALGATAHSAVTASLVLAGGAGALYVSQSCYWSVTADYAGEYTGPASGAMNMGCQIGGAITASVTPLIAAHFGWISSFLTAATLAVLGGVAWLLVDPEARLEPSGRRIHQELPLAEPGD
jgi:ACS family glucarate transporter-like MFS transporter